MNLNKRRSKISTFIISKFSSFLSYLTCVYSESLSLYKQCNYCNNLLYIYKDKFNNLTKRERDALYNLKNDKTIVIKGADKGSAVVVWDREDYIKEVENQLGDTNIYEEVPNDAKPLMSIIRNTLGNIRKRRDVCIDTLNYFLIKDAKFARLYLLPKNHKRLYNVPVISNCGYYTENIFLHFWISVYSQLPKKSNHI